MAIPFPPHPGGYEQWAVDYGLQDAEYADTDGDGRSNLLEFQLGSDPLVRDGAALQLERIDDRLQLSYQYDPRAEFIWARILTLELQLSYDGRGWIPAVETGLLRFTGSEPGTTPGTVRNRYEFVLPLGHPLLTDDALSFRLAGG